MFGSNLLESSYQKYIEVYGDKVKSPTTNKLVKLTKTRFAQLYYGFENWSELKKLLQGINSTQDLLDILIKDDANLNNIIASSFKEFLSNSSISRFNNSKLELKDILYLSVKINSLAENDYKFYIDNGLKNRDIPVSLFNAVRKILSDPEWRKSVTLGRSEYKFLASNMWFEQNIIQKLDIIKNCKIPLGEFNSVKYSELWNELTDYLNQNKVDSWKSLNSFDVETVRNVCSEAVVRSLASVTEIVNYYKSSKIIESEHYYHSEKGLFPTRTNLEGMEPLKILFGSGKLGTEDIKIIDFYNDYCTKVSLKTKPKRNDDFFGIAPTSNHDDRDISFLLRSKSHLASPVLATYMLYNFGSSNFNIERLYAILYHMKRHPQLQPLIDKLEPLAVIEEKLSYNDTDMRSEILAATILARNASDLNSRDGFNAYKKTLASVYNAGHYELIIKECARLLNITMLEVEAGFIKNILVQSMVNISEYDLGRIPLLYINAAYYIVDRLKLSTLRLEPYVDKDVAKISNSINSTELLDILNLRQVNKEKNYPLILKSVGMELQTILHQGMGYRSITESVISTLSDLLNIIKIHDVEAGDIGVNGNIKHGLTAKLRSYLNRHVFNQHEQVRFHYSRSARRGGSNLAFFNERTAVFETLPSQIKKIYDHIKSKISYNEQLYSINLVFHLYLNKVTVSKIKEITEDYMIISHDEYIDVYGSLSKQEDVYRILKTYKPNQIRTHSIEDIRLVISSLRTEKDKYSMGYTQSSPKVVTIANIKHCDFDSIERLNSLLGKVGFGQYANKSPLENIIEKIAPKFTYYGFEFNAGGTDYMGEGIK